MAIPPEYGNFDAAYHLEAIPHAPDKTAVYAEVFRVLRPGGVFAGYDWCMKPRFGVGSLQHRELKERIEYSNAAPELATFTDVTEWLQAAGFEHIEARDHAPDAAPDALVSAAGGQLPERPAENSTRQENHLGGFALTGEGAYGAQGSLAIQDVLNMAADSLVTAGRLRILTPMYFHKARKPA